jgi:hypothetical protein
MATRNPVFTDDASSTSMASYTQMNPNWGSISKAGGVFVGAGLGANTASARVTAGVGSNQQYAKITCTGLAFNGSNRYIGVQCRASAGVDDARDFYAFYVIDDGASTRSWALVRVDNGAETVLASGSSTVATTDTVELEVEDSTLRGYISGVLKTTQTDSTYSSGDPAPMLSQDQTADTFEAGTLTASVGGSKMLLLGAG